MDDATIDLGRYGQKDALNFSCGASRAETEREWRGD